MKKSYLKEFLSQHLKKNSKLLLGLSGGADSMALFSFLIEYMPILKFSLHVAHVDHRWREESRKEAQFLHDHAQQLKVPFHLKVLDSGYFCPLVQNLFQYQTFIQNPIFKR